ncbi:gamma-glutamylcyclotransferase family protein [Chromobacterium piscinae]|uniref:gamma-glutamylcyclotransferase family protein n=1 Tax=Chromobacterium piscinae TaxID=686831 RepID=UPI003F7FE909
MPKLFSYGTLRQDAVQLAAFGRLLAGRTAALPGYRLDWLSIVDPSVVAASGKNVHPIVRYSGQAANRVPGAVFDISDAELAQADRYEAADYRRIEARLDNGERAWVYVAAE